MPRHRLIDDSLNKTVFLDQKIALISESFVIRADARYSSVLKIRREIAFFSPNLVRR